MTKIHLSEASQGQGVCAGACQDILSKVKDKSLYLASSTTKKEAQCQWFSLDF